MTQEPPMVSLVSGHVLLGHHRLPDLARVRPRKDGKGTRSTPDGRRSKRHSVPRSRHARRSAEVPLCRRRRRCVVRLLGDDVDVQRSVVHDRHGRVGTIRRRVDTFRSVDRIGVLRDRHPLSLTSANQMTVYDTHCCSLLPVLINK